MRSGSGSIRTTAAWPVLGRFIAALCVGVAASFGPPARAADAYRVTDLGVLGTPNPFASPRIESYGYGLNNAGQVTGLSETSLEFEEHAFVYDARGGMRDIGTLNPQRGSFSIGRGINRFGQVAGTTQVRSSEPFVQHAFRHLPGVGMQDLGTLGGLFSSGYGINSHGQVVGTSDTAEPFLTRAFLATPGRSMVDLGTLSGARNATSHAFGINDRGQVTGYSADPGRDARAFVWTGGGGMSDLGTLGGPRSEGAAINNAGQVAGASHIAGGRLGHAFRYDPGRGMLDLGTLGETESFANGINARGDVVGVSFTDLGEFTQYRPFLYRDGAGIADLNTLLDPSSGRGWNLSFATAINDFGQITGWGSIRGDTHAYLLTPVPEPAAWALMLAGICIVAAARRLPARAAAQRRRSVGAAPRPPMRSPG